MRLDYVPLLQVQRDLQEIPRGMDRFRTYLRTVLNEDGTDVDLVPLLIANPMARDHVTILLDALLALDADGAAARAAAEASAQWSEVPGDFQAALVVADDAKGGGTNRYAYELDLRFGPAHMRSRPRKRFWITAVLWSSETPTERAAREAVLTAAYRLAYAHERGPARTLRAMLAQEGAVMAAAGCAAPALDAEDLAYTREVLRPYLDTDADDMGTVTGCLFGDEAARSLGFPPRGLSPWAGLALALHEARSSSPIRVAAK